MDDRDAKCRLSPRIACDRDMPRLEYPLSRVAERVRSLEASVTACDRPPQLLECRVVADIVDGRGAGRNERLALIALDEILQPGVFEADCQIQTPFAGRDETVASELFEGHVP